jgi:chaperone required for assembly of F1-ATPase
MEAQLVEYGASDLVCYHATHPEKLVKLHKEKWSPLVAWLKEAHGVALDTVAGIQYHPQPEEEVRKIGKVIMGLSAEDFIVVQAATATTGSVVIALALQARKITPHEAYEAACVDEIYQLETWGADALAQKRLDNIHTDLDSIAQFRDLAKATP